MLDEDSYPPVTATLATLGQSISNGDLPDDTVFLAKQCVLDWVGVTLAGSLEPLSELLLAEIVEQGGHGQATLVGRGRKATTQQAALFNGAASHALDYDDVNTAMAGHPTVPVMPAAFALGEHRGATGRDLIAAFIAGFETECRLGLLVNPGHYAKGWHATATLGTFGSAAACSSLLRLDHERWSHALGMAAAQAAGLKSMFGTMCKPFHAGKAAANGLLAASLAARGFTSNPAAIEADQGFVSTQAPEPQFEHFFAGPTEGFALRSVLFKYHAACYGTHSSIEGVLRLKAANHLSPEDVTAIHLSVPESALSMCNIEDPQTALEGKFSLRFTSALALATDDTTETAFTDDAVRDSALRALLQRVSVSGNPESLGGTEVTICLSDGRRLSEKVDVNTPQTDLVLQWKRLGAKFSGLATPVVGAQRAAAILEAIGRLETIDDVSELTSLFNRAPRMVSA
jgi:2-methylcitrate dehydratase PrpD